MENKPMTVKEVADLFRVHPETIRRYCRQGVLKSYKIGKSKNGNIWINSKDLVEYGLLIE